MAWDVTTVGGSHRLKEGKKGGGSAGASGEMLGEESRGIRVRHCTFLFLFLFGHNSLLNLLSSSSTSSPPSFPFSITGHLHLLIEPFCH